MLFKKDGSSKGKGDEAEIVNERERGFMRKLSKYEEWQIY